MKTFSQRFGLSPDSKPTQIESMDTELRNQIWNYLQMSVLNNAQSREVTNFQQSMRVLIWSFHWKKAIDELPINFMEKIKHFVLTANWHEVYSLIEYIVQHSKGYSRIFAKSFNGILEKENSGYKFIEDQLVIVTSEVTISTIETALTHATRETTEHLKRALALVSDRENPDYRNSIKESISAVESACKHFSGKTGGDLNECIRLIKRHHAISPHFETALLKLYAFTNQGTGIRHALTEDSVEVSRVDALYMIAVCSAFCDYLWGIAAKK